VLCRHSRCEGLKKVGLDPERWALSELRKGVFHSQEGVELELERGRTEAYVIDRAKFDRDLAESAVRAGADLELQSRCTEISVDESMVQLEVDKENGSETVEGRMVIGADGPNSFTARSLGLLGDFSPTVGIQAKLGFELEDHSAHVFLSKDLSRDFFAWTVPFGDTCRVGLGCKEGNPRDKLVKFISRNPLLPENSGQNIISLTTGLIPESGERKIYGDRAVLVGDAAGHVKPLTGGGLYLGLSAAEIASEVIIEALEGEPRREVLKEYEDRVEKEFGKEFELGGRARNVLKKMSDEDISELMELLSKEEIRGIILDNAEFDDHSSLFKVFMKKGPSLIPALGGRNLMKYLGWFMDS